MFYSRPMYFCEINLNFAYEASQADLKSNSSRRAEDQTVSNNQYFFFSERVFIILEIRPQAHTSTATMSALRSLRQLTSTSARSFALRSAPRASAVARAQAPVAQLARISLSPAIRQFSVSARSLKEGACKCFLIYIDLRFLC